jgi:hypothetical protein
MYEDLRGVVLVLVRTASSDALEVPESSEWASVLSTLWIHSSSETYAEEFAERFAGVFILRLVILVGGEEECLLFVVAGLSSSSVSVEQ